MEGLRGEGRARKKERKKERKGAARRRAQSQSSRSPKDGSTPALSPFLSSFLAWSSLSLPSLPPFFPPLFPHPSLSLPSRSPQPPQLQRRPPPQNDNQAANTTGFVPYAGEGFALLLPSKWNPRRQVVTPGVLLSYEDNGDAVNHVDVIVRKASGSDIGSLGGPDKFLNDVVRPLLGEQVFEGATRSEGGFAENKVAAASLLDVQEAKDKSGRNYYKYELLTRTADGSEGGR